MASILRPLSRRLLSSPSSSSAASIVSLRHTSSSTNSNTTTSTNPVQANNQHVEPKPTPAGTEPMPVSHATTPVTTFGAKTGWLVETEEEARRQFERQAPNRQEVWSRSQQERKRAMVGPRFEQTIMEYQPQPFAAIELIHKQPVRWTDERVVACDGGGGPLGHPRIYINVDKSQICWCTYCGVPYAHNHHRKHLESLPNTTYPLEPTNNPAQVNQSHQIKDESLGQR